MPEKREAKIEHSLRRGSMLSPEQTIILSKASDTFSQSRYVSASSDLAKTMVCLEKVQETESPQIKITRIGSSIRIIVSAEYQTELAAIITGTCFEHRITINDAEAHTFATEKPLAVLFFEADFNTQNLTPE
jgi:hypothetical protein